MTLGARGGRPARRRVPVPSPCDRRCPALRCRTAFRFKLSYESLQAQTASTSIASWVRTLTVATLLRRTAFRAPSLQDWGSFLLSLLPCSPNVRVPGRSGPRPALSRAAMRKDSMGAVGSRVPPAGRTPPLLPGPPTHDPSATAATDPKPARDRRYGRETREKPLQRVLWSSRLQRCSVRGLTCLSCVSNSCNGSGNARSIRAESLTSAGSD